MSSIRELTDMVVAFRDERNWKQFHTIKDMMLSLMLEAAELSEVLQWQTGEAVERTCVERKEDLEDELSDVLYWVLLLSHDLEIDLVSSFQRKMEKNGTKYPVDVAKDSNKKYNRIKQE